MTKRSHKTLYTSLGVLLLGTLYSFKTPIVNQLPPSVQPVAQRILKTSSHGVGGTVTNDGVGKINSKVPTKALANTALTNDVKSQLKATSVVWQSFGSYVINGNKTSLTAKISNSPYATNSTDKVHGQTRALTGNALINKTIRQYANRADTGNGATNWKPVGFHQLTKLSGGYTHAVDRGHLLAYALVGKAKGFDASESNPANIATQTAWANEAQADTSRGQNYYEGLVRKAVDNGKTVRYRVTDIYQGSEIVPRGAHIEAKSSDNSLQFNVFVPNVQTNITMDYKTGAVAKR